VSLRDRMMAELASRVDRLATSLLEVAKTQQAVATCLIERLGQLEGRIEAIEVIQITSGNGEVVSLESLTQQSARDKMLP